VTIRPDDGEKTQLVWKWKRHRRSSDGVVNDPPTEEPQMVGVTVKFIVNEKGCPAGKLADAELHFSGGLFDGLKLIGFAIWERRGGAGRDVTFPARSYAVNGERRSFALLRPSAADMAGSERVRDLILTEYAHHEEQLQAAS
jgi:hypothetical protein